MEQAIEMGIDAASGWILGELEDGRQIPHASEYSEIATQNKGMVNIGSRLFISKIDGILSGIKKGIDLE